MDLEATATAIAAHGQNILLRRLTGRGFSIEVACKARVMDYRPTEIEGGIVQGDRKVIIAHSDITAARWPWPVRRGDVVILLDQNGVTTMVQSAYPSFLEGQPVRHTIQVRGT